MRSGYLNPYTNSKINLLIGKRGWLQAKAANRPGFVSLSEHHVIILAPLMTESCTCREETPLVMAKSGFFIGSDGGSEWK